MTFAICHYPEIMTALEFHPNVACFYMQSKVIFLSSNSQVSQIHSTQPVHTFKLISGHEKEQEYGIFSYFHIL